MNILSFTAHCFLYVQTGYHRIKMVSAFLTCLSCGGTDQRSLRFVTGQGGGEKLGALLSPWQPLVKLILEGADTQQKYSVSIPEINQKGEPYTEY
jgi:hypothetical protein